jgi:hypothetical protein
LWVTGITCVLLLATVECLYRAALTRLPVLPPNLTGAAVPQVLARATWAAEEHSAMLRVRGLMPWTILRVLTAVLRARKRPTSSLEGFALANHEARQWLHLVDPALRRDRGLDEARPSEPQGLRGLPVSDFCWRRSEKLPLPRGSTSAAILSRFACARGLAGSPPSASFS